MNTYPFVIWTKDGLRIIVEYVGCWKDEEVDEEYYAYEDETPPLPDFYSRQIAGIEEKVGTDLLGNDVWKSVNCPYCLLFALEIVEKTEWKKTYTYKEMERLMNNE